METLHYSVLSGPALLSSSSQPSDSPVLSYTKDIAAGIVRLYSTVYNSRLVVAGVQNKQMNMMVGMGESGMLLLLQ